MSTANLVTVGDVVQATGKSVSQARRIVQALSGATKIHNMWVAPKAELDAWLRINVDAPAITHTQACLFAKIKHKKARMNWEATYRNFCRACGGRGCRACLTNSNCPGCGCPHLDVTKTYCRGCGWDESGVPSRDYTCQCGGEK